MTSASHQRLLERASGRLEDARAMRRQGLVCRDGHFFPSVHYPPITMYEPIEEDAFLETYAPPPEGRMVVYVHIPFCPSRCTFCHYPVTIGASELRQETYLDLLEKELDLWLDRLGLDRLRAESVLIAGGTPTALTPRNFRRFHEMFTRRVDLSDCTQIAYDVDPHTLLGREGTERLAIMRDHGSERLTIGVQALDDDLLRHMNRMHDAADAEESIRQCRRAGYDDICIEFIFGYPTQTLGSWLDTVERAIATGVEEIQLYRLKIEAYGDAPGPIGRLHRDHPEQFADADTIQLMKQAAILMLAESGYHENLTRVFARDRKHISHYAADQCCRLLDCLGVGLSAFSSLRDRFCINPFSLREYAERIESGRLPLNRGLVRDRDADLRWHVVLPLKNMFVSKRDFHARTGERVEDVFRSEWDALLAHGLVDETERRFQLTPRGRFFADEVCTQFHHPRYLPFPLEHYHDGPLRLSRPLDAAL